MQHCLLMLPELRKQAVDDKKAFRAPLNDLSKSFACLNHDLLISNLHSDGPDLSLLKLLQDYLSYHKQRTKIDSNLSGRRKILAWGKSGLYSGIFII